VVLVIAYPLAVYYGLTHLSARAVSAMVLALLVPGIAIRFRNADRATFWSLMRIPIAILVLMVFGMATDDSRFVLAMPVLINAALLIEFGSTLHEGAMPMIERFARMQVPELDAPRQTHCRQWTIHWCVFFVMNGGAAAALAVFAPLEWWTIYTGAVAYGLMGSMFIIERVHRYFRFGREP
jgi:uncharacterized membrane protein